MAERVAHQPVKPEFITTAIETQRKDAFDYSLKMERFDGNIAIALPLLQDTRQLPHVAVELLICGVKRGNLGKGLNAFIAAFGRSITDQVAPIPAYEGRGDLNSTGSEAKGTTTT
jgi:hypothetical protein